MKYLLNLLLALLVLTAVFQYGRIQGVKYALNEYNQELDAMRPKNDVEWVQREWNLSENDAKDWLYDSEYQAFRKAVPN